MRLASRKLTRPFHSDKTASPRVPDQRGGWKWKQVASSSSYIWGKTGNVPATWQILSTALEAPIHPWHRASVRPKSKGATLELLSTQPVTPSLRRVELPPQGQRRTLLLKTQSAKFGNHFHEQDPLGCDNVLKPASTLHHNHAAMHLNQSQAPLFLLRSGCTQRPGIESFQWLKPKDPPTTVFHQNQQPRESIEVAKGTVLKV